jgi:hypothetical protein
MHSTGQTAAHAPQSVHFSGSISYLFSPWLMAPTGHSGSQEPQDTQSSPMTYAILFTSLGYGIGILIAEIKRKGNKKNRFTVLGSWFKVKT